MAKPKSSKKAQREHAPSSRARPLSTKPFAKHGGWLVSGFMAVALLISAVIFFRRDVEPAAPVAVTEAATTAPTAAPRLGRPRDAPAGIVDYCRRSPKFRDSEGFSTRSVLSTTERGVKGAIMIELDPNGQVTRNYQHPTWDDAGFLGHVVLDRGGNIYTFPVPYVSLIDNPPELQNIVYRIDSTTAEMTGYYTITAPAPATPENPFGIMGVAYDCDTESLYASSVAGSTRAATVGEIVRLDLASREVRFRYEGVDAFGLGIYMTPTPAADVTTKRLYYGLARAPEIYSIGIDEAGDLLDDVRLEITLPDPTLKARRLIFARDGKLEVRSRAFDFNLIATSERAETIYYYTFDAATQNWQLMPS